VKERYKCMPICLVFGYHERRFEYGTVIALTNPNGGQSNAAKVSEQDTGREDGSGDLFTWLRAVIYTVRDFLIHPVMLSRRVREPEPHAGAQRRRWVNITHVTL
jgi:hypothetical protein